MVSFNPLLYTYPPVLRHLFAAERWRWSLVGSIFIHVVLILGIGFVLPKVSDQDWSTPLAITLVEVADDRKSQEPDLLAQHDSLGGGWVYSTERALTSQREAGLPQTLPSPHAESLEPSKQVLLDSAQTLLTAKDSDLKQFVSKHPSVSVQPRLQRRREQLLADLGAAQQTVQKGLREKYLGARTKAYRYAHYMEQWRVQVEEIGNLNYPDDARRQGLSGSLVLDVAIRADGTIRNVRVARSSGNKVLDDAAQRIVRLASPFAPFPKDFAQEVDVLHMVRTWDFLHNRLSSQ